MLIFHVLCLQIFEQLTEYHKETCNHVFKRINSKKMYCGAPAFPKQEISKPTWLSFPKPLVTVSPSSLPCLEFPKGRGECCRQQCRLSGSDQGFIVRKSPFSGTSLSASSPQPSPSPPAPTSQRFQGFMEMKSCSSSQKRLGGDKVINTYFVRESIRASILEHSFGL